MGAKQVDGFKKRGKKEGNSIIMRAYHILVFAKLTSQVLGQGNCEKLAKLDADQLTKVFMKTMGASDSELLIDTYVKNLTLLVLS